MRQRNELVPFMLLRHDDERQAVRELTEKEYESVVGGSFDPKREVASCCDTTTYRLQQDHRCLHGDPGRTHDRRLVPSFRRWGGGRCLPLAAFVDDTAFAFRVDSQEHKLTSTDWRYGNSFLPFEPVQLPVDVLDMLKTLMERSRLHTGSVDIIVDTHGDYWFLEVNQDGAWGWLDDIVGGKIGDAFASALCRAAAS